MSVYEDGPRRRAMTRRIRALITRLYNGSRRTGDRVSPDEELVLAYVGHQSRVLITDDKQLLRQLNDKLTQLANND